ncbi:glycosyltransferase, partial [Microcystis aeruginosa BLCCF158]
MNDQTIGYESISSQLCCTILPTYNERDNIIPLLKRLLASMPPPYLIIVIDDNSGSSLLFP